MVSARIRAAGRFAVPQVFTSARVLIGVWALFAALFRQPELAARLLIIGVLTDALDGISARLLDVRSNFGCLFDIFADYLYYIVVPGVLSVLLTEAACGPYAVLVLGLPFLTGAIRYAHILTLILEDTRPQTSLPGLGTNLYAFYVVALVFLKRDGAVGAATLHLLLLCTVPVLALLMIAPLRYPKLARHNAVLIPVVAGLNVMPLVFTVPLSILTIGLIVIYVVFSPLVADQHPAPADAALNRPK